MRYVVKWRHNPPLLEHKVLLNISGMEVRNLRFLLSLLSSSSVLVHRCLINPIVEVEHCRPWSRIRPRCPVHVFSELHDLCDVFSTAQNYLGRDQDLTEKSLEIWVFFLLLRESSSGLWPSDSCNKRRFYADGSVVNFKWLKSESFGDCFHYFCKWDGVLTCPVDSFVLYTRVALRCLRGRAL